MIPAWRNPPVTMRHHSPFTSIAKALIPPSWMRSPDPLNDVALPPPSISARKASTFRPIST